MNDVAGARQEIVGGVFGADACLYGVAVARDLRLRQWQAFARGDAQHQFDDIETGDALCYRMFDLQARVHLEEIIGVVLKDEFDGAGAAIVQPLAEPYRIRRHTIAQRCRQVCRRRFLDYLLVPAL